MKEKYFTVFMDNKLHKYDILFSFKDNDINYVVYSDDDNNFLASRYIIDNNKLNLYPIENKEEWVKINRKLGDMYG